MELKLSYTLTITALLIPSAFFLTRLVQRLLFPQAEKTLNDRDLLKTLPESTELSRELANTFPDIVVLPHHTVTFQRTLDQHWARQECEVVPACIIQPRDVQQLCAIIAVIKREYDGRGKNVGVKGLFAVRSGGHSPVPGAASIAGGVLIDMSQFCEVTLSDDGSTVVIGAGARWGDVSRILDRRGLAVVGGRNDDVGVGGSAIGGGISFFSSRFGFICSNIVSYEVVLASGSVITASATTNADLWRALKGGANNFGIVTRFTVRSFPCTKIWSGYIYLPSFQTKTVLKAFHDFVARTDTKEPTVQQSVTMPYGPQTRSLDVKSQSIASKHVYDKCAAGPIACFSYVQSLGFQIISVNLVHTDPVSNEQNWYRCWRTSTFLSLWRFWRTCKLCTLTEAYEEMSSLNPRGRRQIFANTTIKNNPATIAAAHAAYSNSIATLRQAKIAGLVWTFVIQPLLPVWARLGDPNPLGLDEGSDEPLVIASFTVNWNQSQDDELVRQTLRQTVNQIEEAAIANGTAHRYKYLNYCADWQKPFEGYGKVNLHFLREMSRKYDPDGLFQRACVGGFKLDVVHEQS